MADDEDKVIGYFRIHLQTSAGSIVADGAVEIVRTVTFGQVERAAALAFGPDGEHPFASILVAAQHVPSLACLQRDDGTSTDE